MCVCVCVCVCERERIVVLVSLQSSALSGLSVHLKQNWSSILSKAKEALNHLNEGGGDEVLSPFPSPSFSLP